MTATESSQAANTYTASAIVQVGAPLLISATPTNGDRFAPDLCVVDCFDVTTGYAPPGYYSLDAARAAVLTYRASRARPIATIQLDLLDTRRPTASVVALRMLDANGAGVQFPNGTNQIYYRYAPSYLRAVVMDTIARATGPYTYRVEVMSSWGTSQTQFDTVSVRVLINNGMASPYGAGWGVSQVERIYLAGTSALVLTDGDGVIAYYANPSCVTSGPCVFLSPPSDFTTVQRVADGSYTRTFRDGSLVNYDQAGLMVDVRDRNGNASQIQYVPDGSGRVKRLIDPLGKAIVFAYADSINSTAPKSLRTITDPMGRQSQIVIDASNDLTRITDPDNVIAFVGTYSAHLLTAALDRRGGQWSYAVGADHLLRAITAPTVVARGAQVRPRISVVSPIAAVWDSVVAGAGTALRPLPFVIGDSSFGRVTLPSGLTTEYRVNRFGEATLARGPNHDNVDIQYDANGLPTQIMGAGFSATSTFTAGGLPSQVNQDGVSSSFAYGPFDLLLNTTSQGVTKFYEYDQNYACLTSARVGATSTKKTTYTCDARGRAVSETDPEGHRTTRYYDSVTGNTWHVEAQSDTVTPANRHTYLYYDAYGRDTLTIDPTGSWVKRYYDLLNRDTLLSAPYGMRVATRYDSLFVREVVVGGTQRYRLYINALGWADSLADTSGTRKFVYDSGANAVTVRNRRGQLTGYTYDVLGRVTSKTLADGRLVKFAYDTLLRWQADSSSEGVDTMRTAARGMPTKARSWRAGHRYEILYGYDADSLPSFLEINRDSALFPVSGRSYFHYDSAGSKQYTGLLYGLSQSLPNSRTVIYHNADGLITRKALPSVTGVVTDFTFEANDRVSTASITGSPVGAYSQGYAWDKLARMTNRTNYDQTKGRTFAYDSLSRLTGTEDVSNTPGHCHPVVNVGLVCDPGSTTVTSSMSFGYDIFGNRIDQGATILPGNRLASLGMTSLKYDADGNTVRRVSGSRADSLFWNSEGQLDSVWTPTGTVSFGYDGYGRRVRKTVGTAITRYFYDGDKLYAEADAAGNISRVYHYYPGADAPAQLALANGALYHFIQDEARNVIGVVNNSGQSVAKYNYSPFGTLEAGSFDSVPGGGNQLRFKGRFWDPETNLYENRARYYDASIGRFTSEDPTGLAGGLNPFTYGENDPINSFDPFGTKCATVYHHKKGPDTTGPDFEDGEGGYFEGEGFRTCCGDRWITGIDCSEPHVPTNMPQQSGDVGKIRIVYLLKEGCWNNIASSTQSRLLRDLAEAKRNKKEVGERLDPGPNGRVPNRSQVLETSYGQVLWDFTKGAPVGAYYAHTHWLSAAQGPDVSDAAIAKITGRTSLVISTDSFFILRPNGKFSGCKR